jgi:hypothetical protein
MQIVERTDDRLVVRHEPWHVWLPTAFAVAVGGLIVAYGSLAPAPLILGLGLTIVVVAPVFAAHFARIVTVTFDKAAGQATVERRGPFGLRRRTASLADVVRIDLEEYRHRKPRSFVERVLCAIPTRCYVVRLILRSERTFSLAGIRSGEVSAHRQLAAVLSAFLELESPARVA